MGPEQPPFTAQSKDDIEQVEEIIHKLSHVEDFPELLAESLAAIMDIFLSYSSAMRTVQM